MVHPYGNLSALKNSFAPCQEVVEALTGIRLRKHSPRKKTVNHRDLVGSILIGSQNSDGVKYGSPIVIV